MLKNIENIFVSPIKTVNIVDQKSLLSDNILVAKPIPISSSCSVLLTCEQGIELRSAISQHIKQAASDFIGDINKTIFDTKKSVDGIISSSSAYNNIDIIDKMVDIIKQQYVIYKGAKTKTITLLNIQCRVVVGENNMADGVITGVDVLNRKIIVLFNNANISIDINNICIGGKIVGDSAKECNVANDISAKISTKISTKMIAKTGGNIRNKMGGNEKSIKNKSNEITISSDYGICE